MNVTTETTTNSGDDLARPRAFRALPWLWLAFRPSGWSSSSSPRRVGGAGRDDVLADRQPDDVIPGLSWVFPRQRLCRPGGLRHTEHRWEPLVTVLLGTL